MEGGEAHSQLQQRQVRKAIHELALTLLHDVFLEDGGGLGIVSVEAVQDRIDVLWPIRRVVEWNTHGCDVMVIQRRLEVEDREISLWLLVGPFLAEMTKPVLVENVLARWFKISAMSREEMSASRYGYIPRTKGSAMMHKAGSFLIGCTFSVASSGIVN